MRPRVLAVAVSVAGAPFTFTTRGRLTLPAGVTPALGCHGKVAVQFKAGRKTVSTRRAN